ncbi:HTH domain-containing protein [Pseudomonas aeruginosa]|uniref:HTH domain-containing protein n=2 Tax=Pseudomonas aeruginosa TaxID=287 RepID=UPI003D79BC1D
MLAGELGISLRTLYRDIATLRQQGAHIEGGAGARRCCASGVNGKASPRSERLLPEDSVEKVALAAACRSGVPAVEVAASHFKLPSGVSLSVLAQV